MCESVALSDIQVPLKVLRIRLWEPLHEIVGVRVIPQANYSAQRLHLAADPFLVRDGH